jgi:8-oxo-dGTP diphosphatase
MPGGSDVPLLSGGRSGLTGMGAPTVVVVAAVIEKAGRFLVTRRQPGIHLEGMWEFPGGKIEPGETQEAALRRELVEELEVEADVGECVHRTKHTYPDRTIELHFYRCSLLGAPRPALGQGMRWVPRNELRSLGFPPADTELIDLLTSSDGPEL